MFNYQGSSLGIIESKIVKLIGLEFICNSSCHWVESQIVTASVIG